MLSQTQIFTDLVRAHLCSVCVLCVLLNKTARFENKLHWERTLYLKLIWIFWTIAIQSTILFSPERSTIMLGNQTYFSYQQTTVNCFDIYFKQTLPENKIKIKNQIDHACWCVVDEKITCEIKTILGHLCCVCVCITISILQSPSCSPLY